MSSDQPSIILDCDPGHDDAIAIIVAARHTNVLGITTVAGNAPLSATTRNAIIVRDLLGLDAPVHSGAERPPAMIFQNLLAWNVRSFWSRSRR